MASTNGDTESYRQSGFLSKMGWGDRPALLLIDVCKAYWADGSPLDIRACPAGAASPDSMRRLLNAAREGGVPVLWTGVEFNDPNMKDAGLFWLKAKSLDVWKVGDKRGFADWMPGLIPENNESVIKKKYPSGFFGTTLATELRVLGVDTTVICGVSTSGCVRASALDALQNGFRPMVCSFPSCHRVL
jgi:nicotinamidase-related amidase